MDKKNALVRLIISVILLGMSVGMLAAQTPINDTERRLADARLRTAEAQARAAEAQARTAEANTRRSDLVNRKAELDLLSAKTTVNGDLVESDISAYKAVSCAASEIGQKVARLGDQIDVLMVYSPKVASTMAGYSVLINQLDLLKERYELGFRRAQSGAKTATRRRTNRPNAAPIVSASIAEILDPIAQVKALSVDMLSLFKTEVQLTGKTVVIGKDEFIAKVLSGMRVETYYPEKMIPLNVENSSKLLLLINDLALLRNRAKRVLEGKEGYSERQLKKVSASFETLNEIYDSVLTQFFPSDEFVEGEVPDERSAKRQATRGRYRGRTLVDYIRAEHAFEIMTKKDNRRKFWLDVHVTKAGSNQRDKSSAIFDIFTGGKRISFSGGAIVNYRIFSSNGRMLASDTILSYMPFKRSKKISKYQCVNVNTIP